MDTETVTILDLIGADDEEQFLDFDLTEVQALVSNLQSIGVNDVSHAENLQQQALRCADILSEYSGKLTKTVAYLESKISARTNRVALEYDSGQARTSIELRKMAGESDSQVEELELRLAKAKGAKALLDKKYDIVIKAHHHYKDIASGMRRSIL